MSDNNDVTIVPLQMTYVVEPQGQEEIAFLVIKRALDSVGSDSARRRILAYYQDMLDGEGVPR